MKTAAVILLMLSVIFTSSCADVSSGAQDTAQTNAPSGAESVENDENDENAETSDQNLPESSAGSTLIAYFSATGTTEQVAEYIGNILDADIYEIVPQVPYTDEDLEYYTGGRADLEQDDPSARPAIEGGVENMDQYDTIFLGYPIRHGQDKCA